MKATTTMTKINPAAFVGQPATICCYSDCHAATVKSVRTTASGRLVVEVQQDQANRTDTLGMSDVGQQYVYSPNPDGNVYTFRENILGQLKEIGGSCTLQLGFRREFYDFSF